VENRETSSTLDETVLPSLKGAGSVLHVDALRKTPLVRDPFDFVVVPNFLNPDAKAALGQDFPRIDQPGLFPVSELTFGPAFEQLLRELQGGELGEALSAKFGVDLGPFPTLVTVRGRCRARDGKIHTDSVWKIISVLLYLNEGWEGAGGRLRLLRSPDLDDVVTEIPPEWGMFLAFRRGERSFHGHKSFEGDRRVIQVNWCTAQSEIDREIARHRKSAWVKRFFSFASRGDY
jgi:SM-20-related protein